VKGRKTLGGRCSNSRIAQAYAIYVHSMESRASSFQGARSFVLLFVNLIALGIVDCDTISFVISKLKIGFTLTGEI
jgi:hypothetical protein